MDVMTSIKGLLNGDFDDGITVLRAIPSAFVLGIFTLFMANSWIFKWQGSDLQHPVWSGLFLLFFLFAVWICISCQFKGKIEANACGAILKRIPALDSGPLKRKVLRFLFLFPAGCILGKTIWKVIYALVARDISCIEEDLILWFSFCPIIDAQEGTAWIRGFSLADMQGIWTAIISMSFSMFLLFCTSLLFAILTKIMTGNLASGNPNFRVLVGIAMVVYTLYLPGWITSRISWNIFDSFDFRQMISFIDRAGAFLVPLYLVTAVVTAIACSEMIWSIVFCIGACVLVGIANLIVYLFPSCAVFIDSDVVASLIFVGYLIYALASQVWEMVPTNN